MSKTKQERVEDVSPFIFRGENLALDLVNTEIVKRRKRLDLLLTPPDVVSWWQAVRLHHSSLDDVRGETKGEVVYDMELLGAVKNLRTALRSIFGALVEDRTPDQTDINVLNDVLRTGYSSLDITSQDDLISIYRTTDSHKGPVLLPTALSALHIIQTGDHKRLHLCDNEQCILFFYDTTRSATRRWCSLECMDRARSTQRYQQTKQQSEQKSIG